MVLSRIQVVSARLSRAVWGNPYFTEDARQDAYEHLMASDYFLCGRVTYELLVKIWANQGRAVARPVRAENLVRSCDLQSCSACRLAVMITGHVPAVRIPPDHADGLVAAAVSA